VKAKADKDTRYFLLGDLETRVTGHDVPHVWPFASPADRTVTLACEGYEGGEEDLAAEGMASLEV
jgi:hypothetical protein